MTALAGRVDQPNGHESHETEALGKRLQGTIVAGTYRLGRCIGAGASSHVFEAEHLRLERKFAIKVLRAELDGKRAAQRFRREATAIARLRSEHIVSVIDCGELGEQTPFLVMELLEGEDLRKLLSHSAPLPARRAVHLAIELCRGLSEVHRAGLVHRDLKPENLFVARRSNGRDWCKILDFGVAKMDASVGTAHGAIVGTVRYMAPEQLLDSSEIGPATDIHAVGAILFECLTGRSLIGGTSVQEAMFRIINVAPRELLGQAELPPPLVPIILSCLEKSPQRRPRSAAELAELLEGALSPAASSGDATLIEDEHELAAAPSVVEGGSRRTAWGLMAGALITMTIGAFMGSQVSNRRTALPTSAAQAQQAARQSTPAAVTAAPSTPAAVTAAPSEAANSLLRAPPAAAPSLSSAAPVPSSPKKKLAARPAPSIATGRQATSPLDPFDQVNPYGD